MWTVKPSERLLSIGWTVTQDGCWDWNGAKNVRNGYGSLYAEGRAWKAHRVSYEHHVGPIPEGMKVLHACDNPPCVNPAHLGVGTQRDNMRQASERGRFFNQRKTHCKEGHPFSPENTYVMGSGKRVCKTCNQARCARQYRRRLNGQNVSWRGTAC